MAALHSSRKQSGPTSIASAPVASPEQLGREHVRSYLLHLAHERQASYNVQKHARLALKFLYRVILGREWIFEKVACSKAPKKHHVVTNDHRSEDRRALVSQCLPIDTGFPLEEIFQRRLMLALSDKNKIGGQPQHCRQDFAWSCPHTPTGF
jgi:Phage integrase, N-terminal SAM-like domain